MSEIGGAPNNPRPSSEEYIAAKNRLRSMGPARRISPRSAAGGGRERQPSRSSTPRYGEAPSASLDTFRSADGLFQVGYPSNWQAHSQTGANATFAPDWAFDGNEISHGSIGSYFDPQNRRRLSLEEAIEMIVRQLQESNTYLREEQQSRYSGRLAGREAIATFLRGRNNAGEDERTWLIVRPSGTGIMYMLFVAPDRDFERYKGTFSSMIR